MKSEYRIDGVLIKRPSSFKMECYNITDLKRTASGDMVGDLIAQKRKFYFTYDAITSSQFKIIYDAIYGHKKIFFTLTYNEDNGTKTCVVYVGSIPKELARTGTGGCSEWVWKNLSFDLIEK